MKQPRRPVALHEPRWQPSRRLTRARIPAAIRQWLLDAGSLTHRVQQACCGSFRVRVLFQGWARPERNEAHALGLAHGRRCLIREVQLLCDGRPWVFARTVIPVTTLRGRQRRLAHLGERPLGAFLFADPSMTRSPVAVTCLEPRHYLYIEAIARKGPRPGAIWGRRSVFRVGRKPLLVSEFFLPGIGRVSEQE